MPENKAVLDKIVNDLNKESNGDFHIDSSWRLRIGEEGNQIPYKLIPIDDYTGAEISDEEKKDLEGKWKQHIMSPLEKTKLGLNKAPQGFGSKHKDYLGHRAIDRAVGRAE